LLEGKDLLGCAQTGTGKTAAFTIPIIQQLMENGYGKGTSVQALVVTPTRELAIQIADNVKHYSANTGISSAVIYGGVGQNPQVKQLKRGVDILVATPGRLLDLHNQGYVNLKHLRHFVLDEADQMLDMGFIHDIKKLLRLIPERRQSLFFSATMPRSIVDLSKQILGHYEQVTISPDKPTADKVSQSVYHVAKAEKSQLLLHILQDSDSQALVFGRTKHGCDKVVRYLSNHSIQAAAIHGNKSQNARQRALTSFKEGRMRVLVATDIAARGIDISGLELVINHDLPNVSETYVHRIGRTGRAEASGHSISFCMAEERSYLKDIEKLIKQRIPLVTDHPFVDAAEEEWAVPANRIPPKQGGRGGGGGGGRHRSSSNGRSHRSGNKQRSGSGGQRRRR
jgi:ATP-dependent RNA helicase RhlE